MMNSNQKKNIYQKIVDNRYWLSLVSVLFLTIVGFFINNMDIAKWLVNTEKRFTLWNNIKFFALILASYELFYIITNKKQNMSVAGTIVLAFSGCIILNLNKIDAIILGEIITLLIYKIIVNDNIKNTIFLSVFTIFCSIAYMFTFRPFAISFGYVFFTLIIWIFIQNKKILCENKSKITILCTTISLSIIGAICSGKLFGNFYGDNINNGIVGFSGLFSYLYTPILAFNEMTQTEILAGIFSIFPIPMCVALYYMYKNDKHAEFLLPLTTIAVLETVYCISGFPGIINKITMLSGASSVRVVPAVQFTNLLIMLYILGNIEEPLFNIKQAIRITIISICVLAIIRYPIEFATNGFLYLFSIEFSLFVFLFLNYLDEKYKKILIFFLTVISLVGGIPLLF